MNSAGLRLLKSFSSRRVGCATALAAAAGVVHLESDKPKEKLSIYPLEDPPLTLVQTTLPLEEQIRTVRVGATTVYQDAHRSVQGVVDRWIGIERKVEGALILVAGSNGSAKDIRCLIARAKSLISPTEPLTPGVLYVGVATLTGSIVARSRGLPSRILLPPTLFLLAFNHFLPQTATNVGNYAEELESSYAPTLGEKRKVAVAHSKMSWEILKEKTGGARESVEESVGKAVEWTEDKTGLRLGETFGWGSKQTKTKPAVSEPPKLV